MKAWMLWVVAIVATLALWQHPTSLAEGYDWRYFESAIEAARRNVVWFHQLPLYNPWMCGGEVQLANPQSIAGSPAFLLVVLFGTAVGCKLMLALFIALGLDGTYRLGKHCGLSQTAACAAALSFGLSGWIVAHLSIGHVSFFGATLIPHLLYFYRRGLEDRRWAVAAGATFAFVVAQGGNSTAVMAALALGALVVGDCIANKNARPITIALLTVAAAIVLGAYRLFPALEFAIQHPRHTNDNDGISVVRLFQAGFAFGVTGKVPGAHYALHEYAWRLPLAAWPLAVLGIVMMALRRVTTRGLGVAVIALGVVGFTIALGDAIPYGPWWLMRHTPVLRDLRVPSRYVLLLALSLSLCAGAGFDALRVRLSPRSIVVGSSVVLLALGVDAAIYANSHLRGVFTMPAPHASHEGFYQVAGHWSQMLPLVFQNRGDVLCDEEAPLTRAETIDYGPRDPFVFTDPSVMDQPPHLVAWTPNGIDVELVSHAPATMVLDTNWNEHYKADLGTVEKWGNKFKNDRDGGRVAVTLPAARGIVSVRYSPTSFWLGLFVSLAGWLVVGGYALRRRAGATAKTT